MAWNLKPKRTAEVDTKNRILERQYYHMKDIMRNASPDTKLGREARDFVMGYEMGSIKSLWDFYKKPSEIRDEWFKIDTKEKYEKKMEEYDKMFAV